MSQEDVHARLSRLLGMGKYGEDLAHEILEDYVKEFILILREDELIRAGWTKVDEEVPELPDAVEEFNKQRFP